MYLELVRSSCSECKFSAPADSSALLEVEHALALQVPSALRALWSESNGIRDQQGRGVFTTQEVIEQNLELRSYPDQNDLYMTFESMFCFADSGNGDLFFYPIQADGRINRDDIFMWNHETDSREWAASDLARFVELWFSGKWFDENE